MKYCAKCSRDLADSFEDCPICRTPAGARPAAAAAASGPTERDLAHRKVARKLASALKAAVLSVVAMVFGVVVYYARVLDAPLAQPHEWYCIDTFQRVTGMADDWGMLRPFGVVRTAEELDELLKVCRYGPGDPFRVAAPEFEIDVDPGLVDFETTTLIWVAEPLDSSTTAVRRIERVTQNFRTTFVLLAPSPLTEDEKRALTLLTKQGRVQSVHVVAVTGSFPGLPTVEDLGSAYSRQPAGI